MYLLAPPVPMCPLFDVQILQFLFTSPLKVDRPGLGLSAKADAGPSAHGEHPKVILISVFSPSASEPLIPSLAGIVGKVALQLHCVTQQLRSSSGTGGMISGLRGPAQKGTRRLASEDAWLCSAY